MKNLLLLVSVALVSLTSCQKDHYLDDLNAAKMEIAVLNGRVSNISAELQAALDRNKELSIELTSIELEITQLNIAFTSITNEANQANITVLLDLEVIINELNQDITVLQSEINELLAQEVVDTATIEILTETIVTIEAQTVNHTIEYVNTVNEVIINTDSTDYALIDALNVRIADLEALLAGIGVTPDPIDVVTPDPIDVVTPDPIDVVTPDPVEVVTETVTVVVVVDPNPEDAVIPTDTDQAERDALFTHAALLVTPGFTSYNVGATASAVAGYYTTRAEQVSAIENGFHGQGAVQRSSVYTIVDSSNNVEIESFASGDVDNDGQYRSYVNATTVTISGAGAVPAISGVHGATDEYTYYTVR